MFLVAVPSEKHKTTLNRPLSPGDLSSGHRGIQPGRREIEDLGDDFPCWNLYRKIN